MVEMRDVRKSILIDSLIMEPNSLLEFLKSLINLYRFHVAVRLVVHNLPFNAPFLPKSLTG